ALLRFFAALGRLLLGPRNGDAAFFGDELHRFGKLALLDVHDEVENVATLVAAEAVENLLDRRNRERRSFFLMKPAKTSAVSARFIRKKLRRSRFRRSSKFSTASAATRVATFSTSSWTSLVGSPSTA